MSVSILIVMMSPISRSCFASASAARCGKVFTVLHFAASCDAALQMLAEGIRPELIVIRSDINLPGMDGLALLHEIKQGWPDLSVMMVAAYSDEERHRKAERCGALEFITKPVDFEFLKTQLRQLPTAAA